MKLLWFFLPVIILIGVITSYTDYRFYKIRNKWVATGFLYGAFVYGILFILPSGLIEFQTVSDVDFFIETGINLGMATLLGVIFWLSTYWSAADAKLFTLFSFLVPVTAYYKNTIAYFPSITILLHTFFILILVLIYQMITVSNMESYKLAFYEIIQPKKILGIILILFTIRWIFDLSALYFGIRSNIVIYILFLFLLKPAFKYFLKHKIVFGIIALLRLFDPSLYSLEFLWQFLYTTIIFFVAIFLFDILPRKIFDYSVPLKNVKEGMILGENIYEKNGKLYGEKELGKNNLKGELFLKRNPHGLSKDEAKKLKKAYMDNKFATENVKVSTHTFFAPYLFAGTMLTIIVGGNLFVLIINVI